jgi:NADPH-dependent glutamate synthase beta subunit-like oxidoreductase
MVVLSRKIGTYTSLKQSTVNDAAVDIKPSKMASDLAKLQVSDAAFSSLETGKQKRVGIIGAGVAGMRCAEVLISKGVDVTVIEARNRVGGRVSCLELYDMC